jgi:hypothetical protein
VAKTCPSCGYRPIGPFTDNCPICAEPVRGARDGGGRARPPGLSPVLKWLLGGMLAAGLGVAGCCGLGAWGINRAAKDAQAEFERAEADAEAERKARTVVVPAAQLLAEFQADPAAADQKYKGKYLEVSGVVERGGKQGGHTPFVVLHGGDERPALRVECFFSFEDEEDEGRIERFGKGRPVTVRGEYDGRVSNVQLRECVLVK